jgi:hypothetical protein
MIERQRDQTAEPERRNHRRVCSDRIEISVEFTYINQ